MPIKWDDKARTTLLLKLIEQNPGILSSVNAEALAKKWPGSPKPTGRAIYEQIKALRKETGVSSSPSTKRVIGNAPRTPRAPNTIKSPSTKRSNTDAHTGSANKKRKSNNKKKASEDESEEDLVLSSSADDDVDDNEDESEVDLPSRASPTSAKRRLPTRSKSRNISYQAEVDSAGEDEAAKASCSDDDETFSLQALEDGKSKCKSKLKMDKLATRSHSDEEAEAEGISGDVDSTDGAEQECEDDSDEGSEATTFHSARDCVV